MGNLGEGVLGTTTQGVSPHWSGLSLSEPWGCSAGGQAGQRGDQMMRGSLVSLVPWFYNISLKRATQRLRP